MGYTDVMESTEDNVRDSIINPFYAVSFADYLFKPDKIALTKEDWVLANTKLVQDMSASDWLRQLTINFTTEPTENLTHMVINPCQAVVFSDRLRGEHEPTVDVTAWITANIKLMEELGTEKWLWQLLSVLETGGVAV